MSPSETSILPVRLSDLAAALAAEPDTVVPLTGAAYVDAHEAFESAGGQQSLVRQHLELEAARLLDADPPPGPLRVLGVGCGGGFLDLPLVRHLGDDVRAYVGVDPNPAAVDRCEATVAADDRLAACSFVRGTLADAPAGRYDLITCAHVLYYAPDRRAFLSDLRARLRPGGTLLIAHAPRGAMNDLAQLFWTEQRQGGFYTDDLRRLLAEPGSESGGPAEIVERDASAGLARSLFDPATRQGVLLLEFLIQARWGPLPPAARRLVAEYLDAVAESGAIPHPAATFAVRSASR